MMPVVMVSPLIQHLGIVGVGLIGGSIGTAARQRGLASKVTGLGRNVAKLQRAVDAGILNAATDDWAELSSCDFVVVATPVDRIVDDILALNSHCQPGTIVTDAGSVKGSICNGIPRDATIRFVGSHPLAGSEKAGFAHADLELFSGRVCVLTPEVQSDTGAIEVVKAFWEALGMVVFSMSPAEHDRRVARTSHLPHLTAAALSCLLETQDRPLAATGFRDTTRIASGDPGLWRAIFEANAAAMLEETDRLIRLLTEWRAWMATDDWEQLANGLRIAKETRDALSD